MGPHLFKICRCTAQQVPEGQFDIAVARAGLEESSPIEIALGNGANELTYAELTQLQLGLWNQLALALHHIGVAQHLAVGGLNQLLFGRVAITRKQLEGEVAVESLNA